MIFETGTASSLIEATFQILNTPHLFDVGVDACLELIRTYWDSNRTENMALIQRLIPAVLSQVTKLQTSEYLSKGAAREWSTVVNIFIHPPSFKPVSLSLSRSSLSKTPKQVFFNPINIF